MKHYTQREELRSDEVLLWRTNITFVMTHGTDEHVRELNTLDKDDVKGILNLVIRVNHHAFGRAVPAAVDHKNNPIQE